jgi:hypothetical protein
MIAIKDDEAITVMRALYFYHDLYTNQDPDYTDDDVLRSIIAVRNRLGKEIKQRGFLDGQL